METFFHLFKAILIIVALFFLAILMRRRGALAEEHSMVLARIVTDLCLPAIVFVTLAKQTIKFSDLTPAFLMLFTELSCIGIAWLISIWAGFDRAKQGAVVFCSAFGSSTFLGYSIILQMFPETPAALTEAVLISEIGVGYPIFILGPVLAAYFGSEESDLKSAWSSSLQFFKSPVFFAFLIGFSWGCFGLPGEDHPVFAPLFQLCNVLASALTPIAILSVGLMFKMPKLKTIVLPLLIVILIKLLIKPIFIGTAASFLSFSKLWKDVLIILAAMPPAILGAVFLRRYGGDGAMASTLLLAASVVSVVTVLFVFWFVG
jgi:malate permease and related proteins